MKIRALDSIPNNSWLCYLKALELETREPKRDNLQGGWITFRTNQVRFSRNKRKVSCSSGYRNFRCTCIVINIKSFWYDCRSSVEAADTQKEKFKALFAVSLTYLENGIKAFKAVNAEANLAFAVFEFRSSQAIYGSLLFGNIVRSSAKAAKAFHSKVSNYVVIFYYSNDCCLVSLSAYNNPSVSLFVDA